MPKKKHKPGGLSRQVIQAQHRNRYFEKIRFICSALGAPEAYGLIPRRDLESLYNIRFLPFQISAAPGQNIPERVLKDFRIVFSELVKQQSVPIIEGGPEMSLDDYFNVGINFSFYLKRLEESDYPGAARVKQSLPVFALADGKLAQALEGLNVVLWVISMMSSDLNSRLYWGEFKHNSKGGGSTAIQRTITVHQRVPERIQAVFDGIARPAVRVGWGFCGTGLEQVFLKPSDLGLAGSFAGLPHEVYVQSHALQRLSERIDCLQEGLLHGSLFLSLKTAKAQRGDRDAILIEYRIFNAKAGYLVAEIKDGAVVVRTFLFLTNNGTPEGKKLEEICGLGKLDKQYLAIDKLSAFMSAGIGENEGLRNLLRQAGCQGLLDLYKLAGPLSTAQRDQSSAALLAKYLGLEAKQV